MAYLSNRYVTATVVISGWDDEDSPERIEKTVDTFRTKVRKELNKDIMFLVPHSKASIMLVEFLEEKQISHGDFELDFSEQKFDIKGKGSVDPRDMTAHLCIMLSTHCLIFHDGDARAKKIAEFARSHKVKVVPFAKDGKGAAKSTKKGAKRGRRTRTRKKR